MMVFVNITATKFGKRLLKRYKKLFVIFEKFICEKCLKNRMYNSMCFDKNEIWLRKRKQCKCKGTLYINCVDHIGKNYKNGLKFKQYMLQNSNLSLIHI